MTTFRETNAMIGQIRVSHSTEYLEMEIPSSFPTKGKPKRMAIHGNLRLLPMLTYTWTYKVLKKARKEILTLEDLDTPPIWMNSENASNRFIYFHRIAKNKGRGWLWMLSRMYRWEIFKGIASSVAADVLMWIQPILLGRLLGGLAARQTGSQIDHWTFYLYAFAILVLGIIKAFLVNYCTGKVFDLGYHCRASIMGAVYRRAFQMASGSRQKYAGGKGINLLSFDANKIGTAVSLVNFAWMVPTRILVAFIFAYYYLGIYSLPAIGFILLMVPLLFWMTRRLKRWHLGLDYVGDERLDLLQETLNNIKAVKFLGYESKAYERIDEIRQRELALEFKSNSTLALAASIDFWSPFFAASLSIALLAAYSSNLQASTIISFVQVMSSLTIPLWILPLFVGSVVNAKVSIKRIEEFFDCHSSIEQELKDHNELALRIMAADFQWESPPPDRLLKKYKKKRKKEDNGDGDGDGKDAFVPTHDLFKLINIELFIPKGSLIAVIGKSGSGKSSLLYALLGQMKQLRGEREIYGTFGLCQQNAWLYNDTVRENIVFGLPFDEEKYRQVLRECSLDADIGRFAFGDATIIGEHGATVSGGQRQRIGLARVAYARPEIALLDDPLSAVDANVGQAIFYNCIKNGEALKGMTRIMTTHHTRFLTEVDLIIVMDEGKVVFFGTYANLINSQTSYRELLLKSPLSSSSEPIVETAPLEVETLVSNESDTSLYTEQISRSAGRAAIKTYIRALGGMSLIFLLIILAFSAEGFKVWRESFLKNQLGNGIAASIEFSIVYASLGTIHGITMAAVSLMAVGLCNRASGKIHRECMERILHVKLSVFSVTPVGTIMNRFGRDLESIDFEFPERLSQVIICSSALISALILLAIYSPIALPIIILPMGATVLLLLFFGKAWRQLQQLTSVTLGPIISHYAQTMAGIVEIKIFQREAQFIAQFDHLNSIYLNVSSWLMAIRRWVSLRTQIVWLLFNFSLTVFCLGLNTPAAVLGLLILYVSQTVESMDWSMRHLAELESCFVAVDRLHQYLFSLPTEQDQPFKIRPNRLSFQDIRNQHWEPSEGVVEFENVHIRYNEELDEPVIKDFTFKFEPGLRYAVVGRSGAGKSTLINAIFR